MEEKDQNPLLSTQKFDAFEYYKFTREEVKREDDLTNHRITSSLTLQGFLIASSGYVVSKFVEATSTDGKLIYMAIILAVGLIGLLLSFYAMMGVFAARNSIDNLLKEWKIFNDLHDVHPRLAPQFVGADSSFKWGSTYYKAIPVIMFGAWVLFISVFSAFFVKAGFENISSETATTVTTEPKSPITEP